MTYTLFPADHSRRNRGKHDSILAPFTADSVDFHPHLLINYLYQAEEEPVDDKHIPRDSHVSTRWEGGVEVQATAGRHCEIMGDSGGFQGASLGRAIDPVACMQWQNRNCDIAFIVDKIPVRHPGDGSTLRFGEIAGQIAGLTPTDPFFIKCAEETAANLNTALKHKDEKVKLYSIIQGNDYASKKKWLEITNKDHDIDGYGIKGTSNLEVMSSIVLLEEMLPDKPVHFLGCGSFSRIAPLVYFSNIHKARVTSDASSHLQGTKSRLYIDPITHDKWRLLPDDKRANLSWELNAVNDLPCRCKACRYGVDNGIDCNSTMFGRVLTLHNLRMMLELIDELRYIRTPAIFKRTIQALNTDAIQDVDEGPVREGWALSSLIDCIDDLKEKGPEYTIQKYVNMGRQDITAMF